MARQRFIHPDIWTDPAIGRLTPVERLFFIGCITNADDEGRLLGDPAFLRSTVFPYDDITLAEIQAMRDRVVSVCCNLVLYTIAGVDYLAFMKWRRYQSPRYPKASKLPPPPTQSCNQTDASLQQCSNQADASLQPNSCKHDATIAPWVGLGRDGMGSSSGDEAAITDATTTTAADGFAELVEFWRDNGFGIIGSMIQEQLHSYLDDGLPAELIRWAMEEAVASGGKTRNWGYVRSILNRLIKDGIHDRPAAEADKRAKSPPGPAKAEFKPAEVWS